MVGQIFKGKYQTVRLLGEGGMGRVYLARQLDLNRQVVVKVMHDHVAADPKFRERFEREMEVMKGFQHPYAVMLFDAEVKDPKEMCIVMEYIRGITLDNLLRKNGRMSPPRVGRLLGQLCEVLHKAHSMGIVHRDLKPSNLMVLEPDTPYEIIKVMDFGLVTILDPRSRKKLTNTATEFAIGTPGYMCPEQVKGEQMDHRGDLYSVGVILYELLTGQQPFAGRTSMDAMLAHATEDPPSFSDAGASDWVSKPVEAVVMSCLAKDPKDRPAHARELAERFERALFDEEPLEPTKHECRETEPNIIAGSMPNVHISDPNAIVHVLQAWMPESIAAYKLRGFVDDAGGEVVESVPGRIRVRLGGKSCIYRIPTAQGALSWLGLGRARSSHIELEMHLEQPDGGRRGLLQITVYLRPSITGALADPVWRARCNQIYCDLRSYLMGKSEPLVQLAGS